MITCPNCNEQLADGTKFCRRCGAEQGIPAPAAVIPTPAEAVRPAETAADEETDAPRRSGAGAVITAAVVAAFCIGGAAVYFGLRGGSSDSSSTDSRPNTVKMYEEEIAPESSAPESAADTAPAETTPPEETEPPADTEPPTTSAPDETEPPADTTVPAVPVDVPVGYNGEPYLRSANIVNSGALEYDGEAWYTGVDGLTRTELDGTRTQLCTGTVYYINAEDERLYFLRDNSVCSMNNDGSDLTVILNYVVHELTYYKGKLYFCSQLGGSSYYICSMNPDGTELKKLVQCVEWYMNISGDTIYFTDSLGGRKLMAMGLDGSGLRCICSDECYDVCVVGDKIYYSRGPGRILNMLDLTTSAITELGGHAQFTNLYLGRLYYVDGFGNVASRNLDGSDTKNEFTMGNFSYLMFAPGKMAYCDTKADNALREVELVQPAP
ncbi:MAG: DUF5050 domain-containing protein [Ruminococcus sp.]|nr:DUF5050 domain-containing protein [Ruminococcus sp.]